MPKRKRVDCVQNEKFTETVFWIIIFILVGCIISFIGGCMVGSMLHGSGNTGNAVNSLPVYDRLSDVEKYARGFEDGIRSIEGITGELREENQRLRTAIIDQSRELREINQRIADREQQLEIRQRQDDEFGDSIEAGLDRLDQILRKENCSGTD